MIAQLRIKSSRRNEYKTGQVIAADALLRDYTKECDKGTAHWLWCVPMPTAIETMTQDWGIEYEIA